jgi:Gpi18-like mannosyltransferase
MSLKPGATTAVLRDLRTVFLLFLAWRGLLFGLDYVGRVMSTPLAAENHFPNSRFWDGYIRHDSLHFQKIIRDGYRVETEGRWKGMSTSAAFFPLYPYTVKYLARFRVPGHGRLFSSIWPPGLIISNVSLLLSLFYVLRIARLSFDEDGARRSLVYLLAFPTSFFFSSFYTEGLFLLTTAASFYHFLKMQHFRCGTWGMLAVMTRSPGIVLLPAFLLGHLWERRCRVTRSDLSLIWLGLIPCGLAAVMGIMYLKLGDPFAFSKAQSAWGRSYMAPYVTVWRAIRSITWSLPYGNFGNTMWAMETASSLAFLVLPFFLLRGFHKAMPIYAWLLTLMPLMTGLMTSMLRYEVVVFPAFFALARLGENRGVDRLIVYGSSLFLAIFKLAFSNGYFLG